MSLDDLAELTDDPKYHNAKCHYCDVELDDGCVFAEDILLSRFYCLSCLEENEGEIAEEQEDSANDG